MKKTLKSFKTLKKQLFFSAIERAMAFPQHQKYTILGRVSRRDGVVPTQGEDCYNPPLGWFESNEVV
jgi:hypothetical protein